MRPNNDEARAAHYNAACCYTALGQWEEAADQLVVAVNDYDLKFSVAIKVRTPSPSHRSSMMPRQLH